MWDTPPRDQWPGERCGWILANSTGDINYRTNIPQLTDEELHFCLKHEHRISGRKQLLREIRKRGL